MTTKKQLNARIRGLEKIIEILQNRLGDTKYVGTGEEFYSPCFMGTTQETRLVTVSERLDLIEKHLGINLEYQPKKEIAGKLIYKKIKEQHDRPRYN